MAYTFLKAKGYEVGKSILDETKITEVTGYLQAAENEGKKILLPVDVRVADGMDFDAKKALGDVTVVPSDQIPADKEGLDIGPETAKLFSEAIAEAKTVFWNGPMGVAEIDAFAEALAP